MLREALGWSQTAIKRHLERIVEMEYVIVQRSGARQCEYVLLYDGRGREGQPTLCGLIDPAKLKLIEPTSTIASDSNSTHPNGGSSHLESDSSQDEPPRTQDERASTYAQPSSTPQEHPKNTASTTAINPIIPQEIKGSMDIASQM